MSELKGLLSHIGGVETIVLRNGGEMKKRTVVIDYKSGQFDRKAAFVVQVDSVNAEINGMRLGDEVTMHYNIESREWNQKWFTDLKVWRIETNGATKNTTEMATNSAQAAATTSPAVAARQQSDNHPANQPGFEDDLPF
jgi:hypothetical protein